MTIRTARFSKKTIEFITKASRQKKPEWLDRNRAEYEDVLVHPMRELMTYVAQTLRTKAPGYRFPTKNCARIRRNADRAKAQGWYKNWIGASASRDSGSMYEDLPALYFHISKEDIFSAGGIYMPSARQTKHIRAWIDQDPSQLEDLLKDKSFKKHFKELGNERMLKTKPRDYPIDHPKIEWLKLTGWYVWRPISQKELCSKEFPEILASDWAQALRLNSVLDKYIKTWPAKASSSSRLWDSELRAPKVDWNE